MVRVKDLHKTEFGQERVCDQPHYPDSMSDDNIFTAVGRTFDGDVQNLRMTL